MKRSQIKTIKPAASVAMGIATSVLMTILLSLFIAYMLNNGTTTERTSQLLVTVIHFAAVFVGALLAGKSAKQKYAIMCACVFVIYCALLLALTVFAFESNFQGIGKGIGACCTGAVVACILCVIKKKRTFHKR